MFAQSNRFGSITRQSFLNVTMKFLDQLAGAGLWSDFGNFHACLFMPLLSKGTAAVGDIITTGTPPGVGMGMKPPQYLKPGDKMRIGIDGLGEQNQKVVRDK